MIINDLINLGIKKLTTSPSAALDAEVLLSYALGKPKEYLLTNPNKKIDPKQEKKFLTLINRRLLGWPVAYLIQSKEFYNLKFYVDKKVLIPRPETEGLIDLVRLASNYKKSISILDIGTGSGCIIISLVKSLGSKNKYFASDISPKAIQVAKKNAKLHRVKVTFGDGNLLGPWGDQQFDVIVANLPYLAKLVDESTKFEPVGALIAAKKGLKLYEDLFKQIKKTETYPKFIFLEIGRNQGSLIKKLAKKILPAYKTKISKDLFGRTRYVSLQKLS